MVISWVLNYSGKQSGISKIFFMLRHKLAVRSTQWAALIWSQCHSFLALIPIPLTVSWSQCLVSKHYHMPKLTSYYFWDQVIEKLWLLTLWQLVNCFIAVMDSQFQCCMLWTGPWEWNSNVRGSFPSVCVKRNSPSNSPVNTGGCKVCTQQTILKQKILV
jgi:hypothetical protein